MEKNEFENNLKVDTISPHGNVDTILSTAAIGYLTDAKTINNMPMITLEICTVGKHSVVAKIECVFGKNLIVPTLRALIKKHH